MPSAAQGVLDRREVLTIGQLSILEHAVRDMVENFPCVGPMLFSVFPDQLVSLRSRMAPR
jgi:hypothetical protein